MNGVVNVFKPQGMTSHDVVAKLRRVYGTKKVGHTGTLDPDAIGVLPICINQATRLVEYLTDKDKVYKTIVKFGIETDTQDISGKIVNTGDLPSLSRDEFVQVVNSFIGEIQQVPPMYSAIKKDGQPLYKLAREGKVVDIEPRNITIYDIKVLMYDKEHAMLEVHCGKGTYIRTLCQDIARKCGSFGTMEYLMRTKSGAFTVDSAVSLSTLQECDNADDYVIDMPTAMSNYAQIVLSGDKLKAVDNGMTIFIENATDGISCILDEENNLRAIGMLENTKFKPNKVFKVGE